jgi:transposase
MRQPRRFEYVPLWGMAVYLIYRMRRGECPRCGVKVESVPWAEGKSPLTASYKWFLARWAKRLPWLEVARVFGTSWEHVFRSVKMAVSWGLANRDLQGVEAIGVDEIQWRRGHKHLTLVYQIDEECRRLLWVGRDRTTKTFLRFFRMFGKERSGKLRFVCSDMWKPYLKVIRKKAARAVHMLDRFHVMSRMNKAIDEVRAAEARRLARDGYCVSKAGVSMATQLWAARLGDYDIPVYEVRPGVIRTDMTAAVQGKYDKLLAQGLAIQRRWGMPEDVGKAVAALVRGDFPYSTGQVILVDGGLTLPRL